MKLIMDENCFIAPEKRQARQIARMIESQGDGRGFILCVENTLIIFDSYGNTHSTAAYQLGIRDILSLIFRKDGGIWVDFAYKGVRNAKSPIENAFSLDHCIVFRAIYKHMGITDPYVTTQDR